MGQVGGPETEPDREHFPCTKLDRSRQHWLVLVPKGIGIKKAEPAGDGTGRHMDVQFFTVRQRGVARQDATPFAHQDDLWGQDRRLPAIVAAALQSAMVIVIIVKRSPHLPSEQMPLGSNQQRTSTVRTCHKT